MDKQSIANAILERIEISNTVDYEAWRIGLTDDPHKRAEEHKSDGEDISFWQQWQAKSLPDAQEIESYFVNSKRMKGRTGGNLSPRGAVYVYIF
jgi:hypothetical protein